jgi:colicin import membrane protein
VGLKSASPAEKIRANSLLAEAEYEVGDRIMRDVHRVEPQISAALWDVAQTAQQIQSVNDMVKALSATDPAEQLKAIEAKRAEQVAAGTAASQKAGEFQTKLQAVNSQIDQLVKQKDAMIAQADAAADKASKLSLKEADKLQDTVIESRRKAGNLGHEIDKVSGALMPLEKDLAAEQAKKKSADEAVAAMDASKTAVEANWAKVQSQIQEQKAQAAKLGEELSANAKKLADLNQQADALRAKALEQYKKSADHYAAASNEAKTLSLMLEKWSRSEKFSHSAEAAAWKDLREVYNLNGFKLLEAQANNAQGSVHSAAAAQASEQAKLVAGISKTLSEAGITVPAGLGAGENQKKEVDAAAKAYTDAYQKFSDVAAVSTKDMKEAAELSRVFSLYGQYLNGDASKLGEAKKAFSEAFEGRKDDPAMRIFPAELRG